jgi:ankyrin repeat protein
LVLNLPRDFGFLGWCRLGIHGFADVFALLREPNVDAALGQLTCLDALLKAGANPNTPLKGDGATPVYAAAQNGQLTCLDALLKAGANPNTPYKDGATPLRIARHFGHTECVALLQRYAA